MNTGLASCRSLGLHGMLAPRVRSAAVSRLQRSISTLPAQRLCSHSYITSSSTSAAHDNGSSGNGETFTITTPLYYVNAKPHMGSAYPTIAADVIARYQRLTGRRVRFLTGTDEHGEKIALAAAAQNLSPQQHCDSIVAAYKSLWSELDIAYDGFIRTTDSQHEGLVQEVLQRVWDKGDIYKAAYSGWYCVDCEEYKGEDEMDAEHNCPTHRRPCQHREEENYFFALGKYQQQLEQVIEGSEFVQPASRRNEVLGWVKQGVRDFSISRSAVQWGIPLRQDPSHTVYVWFDALNGYLSGLLPLTDGVISSSSSGSGNASTSSTAADPDSKSSSNPSSSSLDRALSQGWPADVHVIGKDILRFHAIYWPGMLMSAGLPLPKQVFGHGFLTKDGLKMGKALGNTLDPEVLVKTYGADAVRLYFMKEVAFGQDGNFSEQTFRDTVNAVLANSVGNLLNRTLGLLRKNYDSVIPVSAAEVAPVGSGHPLRDVCEQQTAAAAAAYNKMAPHAAIEAALQIAMAGNLFIDQTAPWTAFKKGTEEDKQQAGRVLVAVLETARILAVSLSPITPGLSAKVYQQLGFGVGPLQGRLSWADTAWGALTAGHTTADPVPVFSRIDDTVPFATEPAPAAVVGTAASGTGKKSPPGEGKKKKEKAAKAALAAAKAAAAAEGSVAATASVN